MKTFRNIVLAVILTVSLGLIAQKANAQVNVDVSFNVFHDALKPHGVWFNYGDFGICWRPHGVSVSWQPYRDGHWVWTDYGWTWVSDYSWGWAPFHYGRWTYDEYYGWIWIPDYEWSPAWVQWRYDDDYIGWAPLPPRARFSVSIGVDIDDFGVRYYHWNFIHSRDIVNGRYRFLPRQRIYKIHRHTTNITNITIVNNHIYNHGPRINDVERISGSKIRQYNIVQDREFRNDRNYQRVENNNLHVYHPEISRSNGSTRSTTNTGTNVDRTNPTSGNRPTENRENNSYRPRSGNTRSESGNNSDNSYKPSERNRSGNDSKDQNNVERKREERPQRNPEYKNQNRSDNSNRSRNTEKESSRERSNESRERNRNR